MTYAKSNLTGSTRTHTSVHAALVRKINNERAERERKIAAAHNAKAR